LYPAFQKPPPSRMAASPYQKLLRLKSTAASGTRTPPIVTGSPRRTESSVAAVQYCGRWSGRLRLVAPRSRASAVRFRKPRPPPKSQPLLASSCTTPPSL
jgi:hypothetical protein